MRERQARDREREYSDIQRQIHTDMYTHTTNTDP